MSSVALKSYITPEQYLELEEKSEARHEYYRGEMNELGPCEVQHSQIGLNLLRSLGNQLEDQPFEVFKSAMRVLVKATGLYIYPDLIVARVPTIFDDPRKTSLLNPTVIIEVLSESNELYDRTVKFDHYKQIESLREYVLVSQDHLHVDCFTRAEEGWILRSWDKLEDVLPLDSIGCQVPLAKIYAKVELRDESSFRFPREMSD